MASCGRAPGARRGRLAGHTDGGDKAHNVRADNATAAYDGLMWRRLISNATLPVAEWTE
eukprot:gene13522-179_t